MLSFVHKDDRGSVVKKITDCLKYYRDNEDYQIEHHVVSPNGKVKWVESYGKTIHNVQNKPIGLIGVFMDISKRKKSELEISKIQALLATAINQNPAGIIIADASSEKIQIANLAALRILGNKKNYYIADPVNELPRNWETYRPNGKLIPADNLPLARAMKFGEYCRDEEFIIRRSDGTECIVLVNGAPICNSDGDIIAGICIFHDITERKKAQKELRERESTLRSILSSAPIGILMVIDRKLQWANNRFYEMAGYKREELIGQDTEILYSTKEEYLRIGRAIYDQINEEGIGTFEAEFRDKHGSPLHILISGMMKDPNSPSKGFVFSILDITQNKLHQQEAARHHARFKALFDSASAGIVMTDLKAGIVHVNQAYADMLDYTSEELIGRNIRDITSENTLETTVRNIDDLTLGEACTGAFEKQYIRKGGSIIDISVTSSRICNENGDVENLMAVVLDITQTKKTEKALQRALEELKQLKSRLEAENVYLREEVEVAHGTEDIIGQDPGFMDVLNQVAKVAATDATVLITGETGAGKEVIARAIYQNSHRRDKPIIRVNCASIPQELFESEFFGHVRGSFTGAVSDRTGRFELADGGTIFLDEVGEIPQPLQSKLLRVLQEGEFERIGEEKTRRVDVRIIAATNRNIEAEVDKGNFREDLYYRLSVFPIMVPPLRHRIGDIPELTGYFLARIYRRIGVSIPNLTGENIDQLSAYHWPGNIRELQNVIERAVITSRKGSLQFSLPNSDKQNIEESRKLNLINPGRIMSEEDLKEIETANIRAALERTEWTVAGENGAAKLLGMKPTTLYSKIKALGIQKPENGR